MRRWIAPLLLLIASTASAQGDSGLEAVTDLDPVELARAVDRGGDDAVLEALGAERPPIQAVRAAPHMAAPELALPRLVELAAGRDPWLAPAAMLSLTDIAERPMRDGMTLREADPIDAPLEALGALADDAAARSDLRAAAALARSQLAL